MASPPPKTPPRFVPTLTEVVQVPASTPLQAATGAPLRTTVVPPSALPPSRAPAAVAAQPVVRPPLPSARPPAVMTPPRPGAPVAPPVAQKSVPPPPAAAAAPVPTTANAIQRAPVRAMPEGMEEYMVHRVMQRVDVVLDQRLREAIATVVQEQTRSVLPRLREEIESVVRHAVYEAVADELASGSPLTPRG